MSDEFEIGCDGVRSLAQWSSNWTTSQNPFSLFLDLIGWSDDNLGEPLYDLREPSPFGYVELGKLADALNEYADRPSHVRDYVDMYMQAEGT